MMVKGNLSAKKHTAGKPVACQFPGMRLKPPGDVETAREFEADGRQN